MRKTQNATIKQITIQASIDYSHAIIIYLGRSDKYLNAIISLYNICAPCEYVTLLG